MVLVFSANSNASSDVGREIVLAANKNLVIIPFKIENVEPEPGKQYYLAQTHWLEAMNPPTKDQVSKLVERVRSILPTLGLEPVLQVAPTQPPAKEQSSAPLPSVKPGRFRFFFQWIGLAVLLIALAVVFWPKLQGTPASPETTSTLADTVTFQPDPTEIFLPTGISTKTPTSAPQPTAIPGVGLHQRSLSG